MIPDETVRQILDTARVEEVVGDFVTLKRRGASLVACCPFHNEKTPSFYVTPSKGIYKCFGCGKSGSAVGFVMEHESLSYPEALRYLARKYNIEIVEKEQSAEDIAARQHRESLQIVMDFAQKFFVNALTSTQEGRTVGLAYCRTRGMEDATISKNGIGWAPSGYTSLVDAAVAAGHKVEYLLDAGLAIRTDEGRVIDKFRERVMFPIYSLSGQVIAYSGRTLKADNPAKYVNSPDTELYKKSRELLGIYLAKEAVRREDKCYLVEGNVDVISMQQLGIVNVVASCGTSLTADQIRLIKRFTSNLTIMYDGDSAGIKAAIRGISLVLREGLDVRVVLLPPGEDPDSFARSHTLDEVHAYISAGEKDFVSFKTDLLLAEAAGDPIRKANLINDIADTIADVPDEIRRAAYVQTAAGRFSVDEAILFRRISQTRRKAREDARREMERQQRASEGREPEPHFAFDPEPEVVVTPVRRPQYEDPALQPTEAGILHFLLRYGQEELVFESDSEYFPGEGVTIDVATFIRQFFDDGSQMANSLYLNIFNSYYAMYDTGADTSAIQQSLLNSPDRAVATEAAELCTDKYRITVEDFKSSLTTLGSWLVRNVPRTLLLYNDARVRKELDSLRHQLAGADEASQADIMQQIVIYQKARKGILAKLEN